MFHLACAVQHDCRFEFTGRFQSFCDAHHQIKKPINCHQPTDLCAICFDEMGQYNAIQSIRPVCCKRANSWFHKSCLQNYAKQAGYFCKCPLCSDLTSFRMDIRRRGVFVPDRYVWLDACIRFTPWQMQLIGFNMLFPFRDASWEETGRNRFYDFDQVIQKLKYKKFFVFFKLFS